MNRIIVENNIVIDNEMILKNNDLIIDKDMEIFIENNNSKCLFNIKVLDGNNSTINILNQKSNLIINFELMANSKLTINSFSINSNSKINISLKEESNINYFHSLITEEESINEISIDHKEPKSSSRIVNHGYNYGNKKLLFKVNNLIDKSAFNTVCSQDNKIINYKDGNSIILPNLLVDNKEVVANHSAYIGKFKDDIIFYMKSRGIDEKLCYNLLLKGFLMGNMNLDYLVREQFLKIINEWDENHE